ncbi:MAG: hypothetical protein RQ763_00105 [Sulfurimonas sp.]|uniref:hypothetical protein n=1 Tax=Sulfurimonas sp. TaxID=2022749 RepID=UPI0028CF2AB4|nr:hypothetical protein [Sulfurimonas sp.]MDT8337575.1 hypothetical protein [Sulfurimonas sp.]
MLEQAKSEMKRDEWDIKEDMRAVQRAIAVFKDKERLADVQELIKQRKEEQASLDSVAEGDLQKALGLS